MIGIIHDLRYALRGLRKSPGFTATAVITMALGIGASTTLFSVTYAVLMKPLPWSESDRLVRITESRQGRAPRVRGTVSNAAYVAWYDRPETIEAIGGWRIVPATMIIGRGEPARLRTAAVTPSLFHVLKAHPIRGRIFVEDDGRPGGSFPSNNIIVLSHALWQEQFGGRDDAVGTMVQVGGVKLIVIGVMPPDFFFPDRRTRAWTPWAVPAVMGDNGKRWSMTIFSALARLRPGVTPAQAAAEATSRARTAPDPELAAVAMFGGKGPADVSVVPAIEMLTADVRPALTVLLGAVLLLLVAATANLSSLQLARANTRRREMAIRTAIGADGLRLARQLLVENMALGLLGGVVGLLFTWMLHQVLPSLMPPDFPRLDDVTPDSRVLLFNIAVSMAAGVACGMLPAFAARRLHVVESLAGRAEALGGSLRAPVVRSRAVLMVAQTAIACVLLIGAALLTRSFVASLHADRGYDPRNVLTAQLPIPADFSVAARDELLNTLVARLRTIPGVSEAAYGNALPLLAAGGFRGFKMRSPRDPSVRIDVDATQRVVSPGYFRALGLRVISGRTFTEADTMRSRPVVVVNRSFAARYLADRPVGTILPNLGMCRGDEDRWEVIGVIDDMRQGAPSDEPQMEIFIPYAQVGCPAAASNPILVIKTSDDPGRHAAVLRQLLREEAPTLAVDSMMSMEERVMTALAQPRLYAVVLVGFGGFALVIAAVGVFGLFSYVAVQRRREFGVRTALGAHPVDIVRLVLGQAGAILFCGIAVGVWISIAGAQVLTGVLYGVSASDPLTFVVVPAVLAFVTLTACVIPAVRAARFDPLVALRYE